MLALGNVGRLLDDQPLSYEDLLNSPRPSYAHKLLTLPPALAEMVCSPHNMPWLLHDICTSGKPSTEVKDKFLQKKP